MPRIHWLREGDVPGEATLAAERNRDWCKAHLGVLTWWAPSDRLPPLEHRPGERSDLAPYRARWVVVVELEDQQEGYRAGYYKGSITAMQLAEKLKEG